MLRRTMVAALMVVAVTVGAPGVCGGEPGDEPVTLVARVIAVAGDTVTLAMLGEQLPREQDRVDIGFEMDGELMLIDGTWAVSRVADGVVWARAVGQVSGKPAPGHEAIIRSRRPTALPATTDGGERLWAGTAPSASAAALQSAPTEIGTAEVATGLGLAADGPTTDTVTEQPAAGLGPAPPVVGPAADYAEALRLYQADDFPRSFQLALRAAQAGHVEAKVLVGFAYWRGQGTTADRDLAMRWLEQAARDGSGAAWYFIGAIYDEPELQDRAKLAAMANAYRQSAEAGHLEGMLAYGECLQLSRGVARDYEGAMAWFRRGAEAKHPGCMRAVGRMYQNGLGVMTDLGEGVSWYRQAAELDDAEAANGMGFFYANGIGVTADMAQALIWYGRAAKLGHAEAMKNLGYIYHQGLGDVPRDLPRAVSYYRQAVAAGQTEAMYHLGRLYLEQPSLPGATGGLELLQAAAEAEYPEALNYLGELHENGRGVPMDQQLARQYYTRASRLGDARAYCNLGNFYRFGRGGLPASDAKAVECYRIAAQLEDAQGMYLYGWMLMSGLGAPQDRPAAIDWYQRAARLDHRDAQAALRVLKTDW